MGTDRGVIIIPLRTIGKETIHLEVENKYGPGWQIGEVMTDTMAAMTSAVTRLFKTALQEEGIQSVKLEFAVGAHIEERSLKLFIARNTSPALFKVTVE